jgi:predicted aspartyl protease
MRQSMRFAVGVILAVGNFGNLDLQAQEMGISTGSSSMPFELVSDFLIVVKGQIGNVTGLKFILDTGATHSVIDQKLTDRLRLKRDAGGVMNFDRNIPVEWAEIPDFQVGPLRSGPTRVMVMNLASYSELAKTVDGIIGLDMLTRTKMLSIDYEKRILSLQLAREGLSGSSPYGCFTIPVVVQGVPIQLTVDTGIQGILLYKDRLHQRLPAMRAHGKPRNIKLGRLHATQVSLPGVRIAGPEVVTTVLLINGPAKNAPPGVEGYIGPAALNAKWIEFDFNVRILRWQ